MLKATSSPTDRLPSITSLAPKYRRLAVTTLLTSCTVWLAVLPRLKTRKLAATYPASCSSQRRCICGSTAMALSVSIPGTLSAPKAWFSAPRLEIGHRQSQQVVEQARAKFGIDAVGGVRKQIGPQDAQDGLEDGNRYQTYDQHVEGAQGPVHQHLVDDHLEEKRRDQSEKLQEERRGQNLAQEMSILVDRGQKPGDVEPAGGI